MDKEVWKDIEGYEGKYQISNIGRVRSLISSKGTPYKIPKILKIFLNDRGYSVLGLHKKGEFKQFRVHRLVAKAFIPNPENKQEVNHIDGNKQNNRADNLEWCTCSENIQHAFKTGLSKQGEERFEAKLTNAQAREIRERYKPYNREASAYALAKEYGVSQHIISNIVNKKTYKEE